MMQLATLAKPGCCLTAPGVCCAVLCCVLPPAGALLDVFIFGYILLQVSELGAAQGKLFFVRPACKATTTIP